MGQLAEWPLFLIYFAKTMRRLFTAAYPDNVCPPQENNLHVAAQNKAYKTISCLKILKTFGVLAYSSYLCTRFYNVKHSRTCSSVG